MSIDNPLINIKNATPIELIEAARQLFLNELSMNDSYGFSSKGLSKSDVNKLFNQIIEKLNNNENL